MFFRRDGVFKAGTARANDHHYTVGEAGHDARFGHPGKRGSVDQNDVEVSPKSRKLIAESQGVNEAALGFPAIAGGHEEKILDPTMPHESIERRRSL
jgi:hypothetical protein